jgi:hypothetical protein
MPPVASSSATAGTLVDNLQPADNLWQSICAPMVNQLPAHCQPIANPLPTHCQPIANQLPNHGHLPSPEFASLQCASAARGGAATAGTLATICNLLIACGNPSLCPWSTNCQPIANHGQHIADPLPTHCQPIANHGRLPSPSVPSSSVRPRGMEAPRAGQPAIKPPARPYSCQHVHRATRALCTGDGLGQWSTKAMGPHRAVSRARSVPAPPTAASACIVRRAHSARGMALGNGAPKQWSPTGPSAALVLFLYPPLDHPHGDGALALARALRPTPVPQPANACQTVEYACIITIPCHAAPT